MLGRFQSSFGHLGKVLHESQCNHKGKIILCQVKNQVDRKCQAILFVKWYSVFVMDSGVKIAHIGIWSSNEAKCCACMYACRMNVHKYSLTRTHLWIKLFFAQFSFQWYKLVYVCVSEWWGESEKRETNIDFMLKLVDVVKFIGFRENSKQLWGIKAVKMNGMLTLLPRKQRIWEKKNDMHFRQRRRCFL